MRSLDLLTASVRRSPVQRRVGRIQSLQSNAVAVSGLSDIASVGDTVEFGSDTCLLGEVVGVSGENVRILVDGPVSGLRIGQAVMHSGAFRISPDESWLGRVIDGDANALDDEPLVAGGEEVGLYRPPPLSTTRRPLGGRLSTGYALFNTILPITRGQRIGLFSGSGVGKSSLMAAFARDMDADVVVIALIGERGREVNQFIQRVLGKKGLKRSVVVAATSDQSAQARRRAAFTAMAVAEHFRDRGQHVLLMLDSITRLAEAHREIATSSGEAASMRGHPPSMTSLLAGFAERAGPGADGQGDITAIFTVLVSGSDMEEPVADTLRGLLDGHVVLSREIAERGRFPAVDILQSVSRSLPEAASAEENQIISLARQTLSTYEESEIMVRSGLYQSGTNADLDLAISLFGPLDAFASERSDGIPDAFERLTSILTKAV
ncbi:MAG: FliI/YscN family ATPase [Paracoccaceae bacterium]|nr:FliI/YscN family ATPase [Paracoccaceae bacterium]